MVFGEGGKYMRAAETTVNIFVFSCLHQSSALNIQCILPGEHTPELGGQTILPLAT